MNVKTIQQIRRLRRIARLKGVTLSRTLSGYLIRRNGRIVKQSFSLVDIEDFLITEVL